MQKKGILLALVLGLLSACDSSTETGTEATATPAAPVVAEATKAKPDSKALAERYAGRDLSVIDVSEVQLDGASTLSVTFSVPLDADQKLADRLHLVDSKDGKVDGAWELSDNQMEVRMRHLEPKRRLVLTVDAGLKAVNGESLGSEFVARLETRDIEPTVGFASRGSLLPARLAEGLPVIALNVDKVNVEFFRIKSDALPSFLNRWNQSGMLDNWESRELLPMADLVYTGRFDLNPKRNTRETLLLPIGGVDAFKEPGLYLAVMRQAGTYNYSQPATLFSLSDIGLSARRYQDRLDVFTQALEGGSAISGVNLEVVDNKGSLLAEGKTDSDGHAELPLPAKAELVIAHKDGQTSLLRLNTAALDLSEFDITGPKAHPLQFFVFGPRDLYRPGETVLLNGLLRTADGRKVNNQPVNVEVRRPDEQVSRKFVWQADESGFYQYQLQLADEAPTGRWKLLLDLGDGKPQLYEFSVEDFLPERLALDLKSRGETVAYRPDESVTFDVTGRYLYGAPASGNRLSGQLYVRPAREAVEKLPGYQFGSVTEGELSEDIELDEIKLDDDGHGQIHQESRWSEVKSPLNLTLQASLQESGGRAITRRISQPVWPADRLPGVRGLFDGEEVDADGLAEFEVLVADINGNKLAANELKVRLVRERRDYYWNYSESDGWSHGYTEKYLNLAEETVAVQKDGTAKVSFPVEWGPYRVEVIDSQTGLLSSLRFWAGYRWQDNAEGGAVRPDQVKLALDKPAYADGDKAQVTVTPPAAGKGYLMVESSEGPLWWEEIDVPAEGKTFSVPVDKAWARHDLYISALVIRPGERKSNATPKRAVGLLHLPLDRNERKLALQLNAAERIRPNQPLTVNVKAQKADGSPAEKARVLLAAVDVGILNITEYATPDPFTGFFGRKAYGADQFDVYGQLIEAGQGRVASLAFGGDGEMAAGGKRPNTTVQIVALQSEAVTLNEQGEAQVTLNIPDFNGELRLMAQVWDEEEFGVAEAKTVVAAPLVAELAAPRFMAGGDQTRVALDLNNLSGQVQNLTVLVSATGQLALENGQASQSLSVALKDKQRNTLKIPVTARGGYGEGVIKVEVQGLQLPEGAAPFSRQWQIGVRPAFPAQLQQFRAVIKDENWTLPHSAVESFEPAGLEARLALSSRPPLNIGEHIRALKAYPYGCAEQTTSGLYPSLYADNASLKRLGIEGEPEEKRRRSIEIGIDRLLGMQRHNGSFGMWGADSEEAAWVSVYVTDFLLRAREQGFGVPDEALKKASDRLLRYLQDSSVVDLGYNDNNAHARFALQAYAGYVLSRSQQAPLGSLRSLYDRRGQSASGLPLVQLAIALQKMGDKPRADKALQEGLNARRNTRDWLGDYGSSLRDQALILALLEENNLAANSRDQRLFELSDEVASQRWLSTQESNALFLAGRNLLNKPEPNWSANLQSGSLSFDLGNQQSGVKLDGKDLAAPFTVTNTSANAAETPLYQQLTLSGYPTHAPVASGQNLSIGRRYLDMQGNPLDISNLRSGELVLVHLSVRANQRVPDALVVDLLPAGLELENQNLAQSSASLEDASSAMKEVLQQMQEANIKHQEFRADRYVAAVDVDDYQTTHLLYLARAVTPGSYRVPPPQVESMYRPNWQAVGTSPGVMNVFER
ncbi:alpha-2-macroglobulin [Ectopseudomonas mendocina]|uniref:Alpha-2-macroglobulin n=1 Tax=Ectopseudomonas mendocina TaxID=300 RepID=A0ABZ2RHT4_ECTME